MNTHPPILLPPFAFANLANNWDSPTFMISVENNRLRGGGAGLKQQIWDAAKDTLQVRLVGIVCCVVPCC
jgi:hypothetical protein